MNHSPVEGERVSEYDPLMQKIKLLSCSPAIRHFPTWQFEFGKLVNRGGTRMECANSVEDFEEFMADFKDVPYHPGFLHATWMAELGNPQEQPTDTELAQASAAAQAAQQSTLQSLDAEELYAFMQIPEEYRHLMPDLLREWEEQEKARVQYTYNTLQRRKLRETMTHLDEGTT